MKTEKLITIYNLMMEDIRSRLTPSLEEQIGAFLTVPVAKTLQDVLIGSTMLSAGLINLSSFPETNDFIRLNAAILGYTAILKGITDE